MQQCFVWDACWPAHEQASAILHEAKNDLYGPMQLAACSMRYSIGVHNCSMYAFLDGTKTSWKVGLQPADVCQTQNFKRSGPVFGNNTTDSVLELQRQMLGLRHLHPLKTGPLYLRCEMLQNNQQFFAYTFHAAYMDASCY